MSAAKRSFFTDQTSLAQRPGAVKPQTILRRHRRKKVQPLKKASRRGPGGSSKTFLASGGLPPRSGSSSPARGSKQAVRNHPDAPRRKLFPARTRVKAGVLGGLIILYLGLCSRPRARAKTGRAKA